MNERPRSVTVVGWTLIVVGCVSLVAHLLPVVALGLSPAASHGKAKGLTDFTVASISALLAAFAGASALRGFNWARWLCVAWMGFHMGRNANEIHAADLR
ncbi:MAG: hypothetical protein ACE14L_00705 [Terriglobales bacterium]